MEVSRRSFLTGAAATLIGLAAPAIVRPESIMPIFVPKPMAPSVTFVGPSEAMVFMENYAQMMNRMIIDQMTDLILYGSTFTRKAPNNILGIERVDPAEVWAGAHADTEIGYDPDAPGFSHGLLPA